MRRFPRLAVGSVAVAALLRSFALAQPAADETPPVEKVTVIGATALPGTGIDRDKVPANTETLRADDLDRDGSPSLTTALGDQLGSISINDNLDDPFQPDILYRGFEASPVLGTPQGLAVFQNGVRINEAFGDAVNWDLVPDIAINRADLVSSNPVYGLNALGGALIVTMKNGFTFQGAEAELTGGSFGRRAISAEYGVESGEFGAYIAGTALDEDGWRIFSPDSLRQIYADVGVRTDSVWADLSFTGANNNLSGESPAPVQELAVDRSLVFTSPQNNADQVAFFSLNGGYTASETLSLQGNLNDRDFRQGVVNGNTTEYSACTQAPDLGLLCQGDGLTRLTGAAGQPISDISNGGTVAIGENDFEAIHSRGLGGALQATSIAPLLGRENHLSVGATLDRAVTDFRSSVELGTIDGALRVIDSGVTVVTPEGTPFSATPVNLGATNTYYGVYATDTFNVTPALAVTASGRYNLAQIDLTDRLGTALSGDNRYTRFNPALGFTYKIAPNLTAYSGYSEANRAPTASEIECADPLHPCLLPSSLASDPPTLRQVVSQTYEAGFRGSFAAPAIEDDGRLTWKIGIFRTDMRDDIYGVASSLSAGYFQNIGGTRRQGVELGFAYRSDALQAYADYSFVEATFRSSLTLNSTSNPFQDADGNIHVEPGDHLPGIPAHRFKAGADYRVFDGWIVGAGLIVVGEQFYRGDESNQMSPLPGYAVVNFHSTYRLTKEIEFFASVENALNGHYATFGVLGDPTGIGAPGIPPGATTNGPGVDNRFQSPAPPLSAYGGVRVRF